MKRITKYKKSFATVILSLFIFTACEKDFLDVNQNPNNPESASVNLVLPTAIGYTAYTVGNQYQIIGGLWSQYWTQAPTASQYVDYDRYNLNSADLDRPWDYLYGGPLNDLQYIIDQSKNTDMKNYAGIAKIMQAYIYQVQTDAYGDIPFSEALQGATGNVTPKYDDQQKVYDGLITMINDGIALIDPASAKVPGQDDLLFNGDMEEWLRFANTLKLKIYMRQSEVRPDVASKGIQDMVAAGAEFLGADESADVEFIDVQFNRNPLYASQLGLGGAVNLIGSETSIGYLTNTNDPRIDVFYNPANNGLQVGLKQGASDTMKGANVPSAAEFSQVSGNVGGADGGASAPVVFLSGAESMFLQAEAVARGWMAGDAKALYDAGISASFAYWGLDQAAADTYIAQSEIAYPNGGSMEQKIEAIITQKWISFNGTENFEAWTEFRRTGYPSFFVQSASSRLNAGQFPARFVYPSDELTRNPNAAAHSKPIATRVWWDVK